MPQQMLDEQQQKVRDSLRHALINWARSAGEASDYTDNLPLQCLHPVGHWYEVPNLLRNGVLARLAGGTPAVEVSAAAQHRHARRGCGPGAAGLAYPERRVPHLRGHHPPARGPRRRPGARQWPGPAGRRPGHAARGGRVRPELLQLEHLLDRPRQAARRFRPDPRRSRRRGESHRRHPRRWRRRCRPTSRSRK